MALWCRAAAAAAAGGRVAGRGLLAARPSAAAVGGPVGGPAGRSFASAEQWHATTILSVRKGPHVCLIGDGQVSMGGVVVKPNARKVRRLGQMPPVSPRHSPVLAGFAGATADAITLFERLEAKIDEHPGQLLRACVDLAKDWRMDKYLRRLDAVILVADANLSLMLTGNGDVLEPGAEDGIQGIGSGGQYAIAAARALVNIDGMAAEEIARRAMTIAADMCVYTNHNFVIETLPTTTTENVKTDQ